MSDNVEDAFGPILRNIQERLSSIEVVQLEQSAKLDAVLDEVQGLKRMSKMALGTASGAEMQAEDAQRAADRANKRLDELTARVEALETR